MKAATIRRPHHNVRPNVPFPNAATRRQVINRIADLTLTFMLGAGAAAIFLFVLTIA